MLPDAFRITELLSTYSTNTDLLLLCLGLSTDLLVSSKA